MDRPVHVLPELGGMRQPVDPELVYAYRLHEVCELADIFGIRVGRYG